MYTFNARIRYSEVDRNGFLSPLALLDYFQDCAIFHSEDRGVGLEYLAARDIAWVLNSWQIDIAEMPKFGKQVSVSTFAYEFKGYIGYRNFILRDMEGKVLACANSIWSLINVKKMKPQLISKDMISAYGICEKLDMEYEGRKLKAYEGAEIHKADSIVTGVHNLDTNNHVNNSQYVHMASEYIPVKYEENGVKVIRIRAEYRKQAFLGDVMLPYICMDGSRVLVMFKDAGGKPYANVEFTLSGAF